MNIEIIKESSPVLARIVIAGDWKGDVREANELLREVCNKWPANTKVKFLLTCGNFINFKWPKNLPEVINRKNPNPKITEVLINEAEMKCKELLSDELIAELRGLTNYITLGVDSYGELYQIQLVCLADLITNKFYWTGKSYPTQNEERDLILISDFKTHFIDIDGEKLMLLGCHDLNIFNNRNLQNTGGWRKEIKEEFRELAKAEKPTIILQHPHTTDSTAIWRNGWSWVRENLKGVKCYAGSGKYYNSGEACRSALEDVLRQTKHGNTIDFIFDKQTS